MSPLLLFSYECVLSENRHVLDEGSGKGIDGWKFAQSSRICKKCTMLGYS